MLAVYETIDLGLVKMLSFKQEVETAPLLDLLQANHPLLLLDPLHSDIFYVSHAFGVHSLDLAPVIQTLSAVLEDESDGQADSQKILENSDMTKVTPILNTFSDQRKSVYFHLLQYVSDDFMFKVFKSYHWRSHPQ